MAELQEWLTENSQRAFPFKSETLASGNSLPVDLIADLKLFLPGKGVSRAYLSRIDYSSSSDSYTFCFRDPSSGQELLSGSATRLKNADSRIFSKVSIGSAADVCLLTPGALWNDPTWNGAGDWSKGFNPSDSEIEPSLIICGPSTFRRIIVEDVPDSRGDELVMNAAQSVIGGYNMEFSEISYPGYSSNDVHIDVRPGAGLGFAPAAERELFVTTINGVVPDKSGNIVLGAVDCLSVGRVIVDGEALPSTLQISSNCAPCCGCENYRKVAAAINRQSSVIRDLNSEIAGLQSSALALYSKALGAIRARRLG